jgi:putative spermidine/putrescine transport system ATP-binding protein
VPAGLDGPVNIMMRPHRIAIGSGASGKTRYQVAGTIVRAVFVGDILQYDVDVAGQIVAVELSTRGNESLLAPGTPVSLSWEPHDVYVFGAAP